MLNLGLGLLVGVFLGSLVECLTVRSTTKASFWGRSYCFLCKKTLSWYDLIPVFSFLFLKGKCRYCNKSIPTQDLLMELSISALVGLIFFKFLPSSFLFMDKDPTWWLNFSDVCFKVFVSCTAVAILATDLRTGLIPDRITIPAIKITLFFLLVRAVLKVYLLYDSLSRTLPLGPPLLSPLGYFYNHALLEVSFLFTALGAALVIGIFFFSLIFLTDGRGMGGGDLKLAIFLGLALNTELAPLALIIAFLSGSIIGLVLIIIRKKHFGESIPFGPFLGLGTIMAILFGVEIINWYSKLGLV